MLGMEGQTYTDQIQCISLFCLYCKVWSSFVSTESANWNTNPDANLIHYPFAVDCNC